MTVLACVAIFVVGIVIYAIGYRNGRRSVARRIVDLLLGTEA